MRTAGPMPDGLAMRSDGGDRMGWDIGAGEQGKGGVGETFADRDMKRPQRIEPDGCLAGGQSQQLLTYVGRITAGRGGHVGGEHVVDVERGVVEHARRALAESEFVNYYQPKVELASGHVIGMEALARWPHPHRGLLLPKSFVPLAESSGLIGRLGEVVLRQVARQLAYWRSHGLEFGDAGVSSREALALFGYPVSPFYPTAWAAAGS